MFYGIAATVAALLVAWPAFAEWEEGRQAGPPIYLAIRQKALTGVTLAFGCNPGTSLRVTLLLPVGWEMTEGPPQPVDFATAVGKKSASVIYKSAPLGTSGRVADGDADMLTTWLENQPDTKALTVRLKDKSGKTLVSEFRGELAFPLYDIRDRCQGLGRR